MTRPLSHQLKRFNADYARRRKSKKAAEEAHRKAVDCLRRIIRRENAQVRRAAQ